MKSEGRERKLPLTTVGVLADTHIPDRLLNLHPAVIPTFISAKVDMILHAGDICLPRAIGELKEIAPIIVVRGNRDIFYGKIQRTEMIEIAGVHVALTHGHGNLMQYILNKIMFFIHGYRLENYLSILLSTTNNARVIVFGHSHKPINLNFEGKLLFNPGSAGMGWKKEILPSVGLLRFYEYKFVEGEIVYLKEGIRKGMKWYPSIMMSKEK